MLIEDNKNVSADFLSVCLEGLIDYGPEGVRGSACNPLLTYSLIRPLKYFPLHGFRLTNVESDALIYPSMGI